MLADLTAALPNYRFTALYSQALDFVNAVRAYGTSLLGALEKSDAAALAMLQQTTAQQLLVDGEQVLDWQVQQAEHALEALNQALALAQAKLDFNNSQDFANAAEITGTTLHAVAGILKVIGAATMTVGAVAAPIPLFTTGAAGFGGTPSSTVTEGGPNAAKAGHLAGLQHRRLRRHRRDRRQPRQHHRHLAATPRQLGRGGQGSADLDRPDQRADRRRRARRPDRPSRTRPRTRSRSTTCRSRSTS